MVLNERDYSYKHFVFRVENPGINDFLAYLEALKYQDYDPNVYKHRKVAEIVTTENGYTVIIFEYESSFIDLGEIMAKYQESSKD